MCQFVMHEENDLSWKTIEGQDEGHEAGGRPCIVLMRCSLRQFPMLLLQVLARGHRVRRVIKEVKAGGTADKAKANVSELACSICLLHLS